MDVRTFNIIKKLLKLLIILTILFMVIIVIKLIHDDRLVSNLKKFTKEELKVLYITSKVNYSNDPIELFNKYDISYKYINSSNLSKIEKSKLEKYINSKNLDNIIIIYRDGKLVDVLIDYHDIEDLYEFFQKNNVLPEIIGNIDNIILSVEASLISDYKILYIPYIFSNDVLEQDEILESISKDYNIEYEMVNAYLLSETQQKELNSILKISKVENQIVILIKNQNIIGSIRGYCTHHTYLDEMNKFNFIISKESKVNNIDFNELNNLLNNEDSSIIVFGNDNSTDIIDKLNGISIDYNLEINYMKINDIDSEESLKVQKILKSMNFSDGFSIPLVIIVQSNKLLDYVIGSAEENYFIELFKENGIIKNG